MIASNNPLADSLREVTKLIPVSKRLLVSDHITALQKAVKSTEDLLVDYRTLKPKMTAEALEARKLARDPNKDYTYLVCFMSIESEEQCTLEEAAKIVKLSPNSLRAHVSKNIWYSKAMENKFGVDDIVEVCRCHPTGEPRVPKKKFIADKKASNETKRLDYLRSSGRRV